MEQIPLNEALMCINCQTITRMPKQSCPHCAGEQLMPIATWLNPRPAKKAEDRRLKAEGKKSMAPLRGLPACTVDLKVYEVTEIGSIDPAD